MAEMDAAARSGAAAGGAASSGSGAAASPGSGDGARPPLAVVAVRIVAGAALLVGLLVATHTSMSSPETGSMLRISIRTSAGTANICHKYTEEELAKLPMHMRRPEVCETRSIPYRLRIERGGEVLLDRVYEASGIHGDRPLTVDENLSVAGGTHEIRASFAPLPGETAVAPTFEFTGPVEFQDTRIRVLTLDASGTALQMI